MLGLGLAVPFVATRGGNSPPLDTLSAAAAYSTRRLRTAYTGSALRVRRSLDNAEADIGFTSSGDLDTAALRSFVGSQNLLQHSEAFDNAYWGKSASSVTATNIVSPTGTSDAELINFLSGGMITLNLSGWTAGTIATLSVWVRRASSGSASHFRITSNNAASWNTGQATKVLLTNEWQRVSLSGNLVTSGTSLGVRFGSRDIASVEDPDCVGNVEMWGAQLNLGDLQPYSPTTSTARDGNGFVTTWYDQSGNARNATQATAANQPMVVSAGVVVTQNNKPALSFDGSNDVLSGTIPLLNAHSINLVTTSLASGSDLGLLNYSTNTINQAITHHNGTILYSYFGGGGMNVQRTLSLNTPAVITRTWNGTANISNADLYTQGVAGTTKFGTPSSANATTTLTIGRAANFATQRMQELTIFATTADRQTLERNQGAYYGIAVQ